MKRGDSREQNVTMESAKKFLLAHMEKVVLGATLLLLLLAVVFFVLMKGNMERPRTELADEILRIKGDIKQTSLDTLLSGVERAKLENAENLGLEAFELLLATPPDSWPGKEHVARKIEPIERFAELPGNVLPVEKLELIQGRGVTEDVEEDVKRYLVAENKKVKISDIVWVSGKGVFDIPSQVSLNEEGLTNQPGQVIITRIEVQRSRLLPSGKWSEFEIIQPATTEATKKVPPAKPKDPGGNLYKDVDAVEKYRQALVSVQNQMCQPPFFSLIGKDGHPFEPQRSTTTPVVPQPLEIPYGQPRTEAPRPMEMPTVPGMGAPVAAARVRQPRVRKIYRPVGVTGKIRTIWFHDLNVTPGGTYRYRMRVWIFNPIYDHRRAKTANQRYALELPGQWSAPSAPITVSSLIDFYFIGSRGEQPYLEIHRWIHGRWVFNRYLSVELGQKVVAEKRCRFPTPGTRETFGETVIFKLGIMPVDLVKPIKIRLSNGDSATTSKLIYADALGKLRERIEYLDEQQARARRGEREAQNPPFEKKKPPKEPADGDKMEPGDLDIMPWERIPEEEEPEGRRKKDLRQPGYRKR